MNTGFGTEDYFVRVQVRGPVGFSMVRSTTTKFNTENPVWHEKLVFGPVPWDSAVAFQLWEEDMKWDDSTKLYLIGREWPCNRGTGDQWVWTRLGHDEQKKDLVLFTSPDKTFASGYFTVTVETTASKVATSAIDKQNLQISCTDLCQAERWSLSLISAEQWCERACSIYNKDNPTHRNPDRCAADTCVLNGEEPTCQCPACVKGCGWAMRLWDNTIPSGVVAARHFPGTEEDNGGSGNARPSDPTTMISPWDDCKCSLFSGFGGYLPRLQAAVGVNSASLSVSAWENVRVRSTTPQLHLC